MKSKNIRFIYGLIIVCFLALISFNITSIIEIRKKNTLMRQLNSSLTNEFSKNKHEKTLIKDRFAYEILLDTLVPKGLNIPGLQTFNDNSKVMFFFDNNTCGQCILSNLMDLNVLSNTIGSDKIVLVGSFENTEELDKHLANINHEYEVLLLDDILNAPKDVFDFSNPIITVLESGKRIKFVYLDSEESPFPRNEYITDILMPYFKSKAYKNLD